MQVNGETAIISRELRLEGSVLRSRIDINQLRLRGKKLIGSGS